MLIKSFNTLKSNQEIVKAKDNLNHRETKYSHLNNTIVFENGCSAFKEY